MDYHCLYAELTLLCRAMNLSPTVGLCATCKQVQVITSARGSRFIMCRLAKTDRRFVKYPPLPVVTCVGYQQADGDKASDEKLDER